MPFLSHIPNPRPCRLDLMLVFLCSLVLRVRFVFLLHSATVSAAPAHDLSGLHHQCACASHVLIWSLADNSITVITYIHAHMLIHSPYPNPYPRFFLVFTLNHTVIPIVIIIHMLIHMLIHMPMYRTDATSTSSSYAPNPPLALVVSLLHSRIVSITLPVRLAFSVHVCNACRNPCPSR